MYLILYGFPYIIILIKFMGRTDGKWSICHAQKLQKDGGFLKDEYKDFVRTGAYPVYQKSVICG